MVYYQAYLLPGNLVNPDLLRKELLTEDEDKIIKKYNTVKWDLYQLFDDLKIKRLQIALVNTNKTNQMRYQKIFHNRNINISDSDNDDEAEPSENQEQTIKNLLSVKDLS